MPSIVELVPVNSLTKVDPRYWKYTETIKFKFKTNNLFIYSKLYDLEKSVKKQKHGSSQFWVNIIKPETAKNQTMKCTDSMHLRIGPNTMMDKGR